MRMLLLHVLLHERPLKKTFRCMVCVVLKHHQCRSTAVFVVALHTSSLVIVSSRGQNAEGSKSIFRNLGCLLVIWMRNVLLAFLQMHLLLPDTSYSVHDSVQFTPLPYTEVEKIILSLIMSLAVCIAQVCLSRSIVQ